MMDELKWITLLSLMVLMLQFTGTLSRQLHLYFTVRDGDDVTLSCENVINDHRNCDSTTWLFVGSRSRVHVELVNLGQIRSKPDRLRVTTNCSLVIKKVTDDDAGRYTCRQFDKSGQQQGPDAQVVLSVVTMTEHNHTDQVNLTCSVRTNEPCKHSVKWLNRGQEVDKENKELITSQSSCSVSVKVLTSHSSYTSRYELFKCQVTTETNEVKLFTFSRRPSGEDTKPSTSAPNESEHSAENNRRSDVTTKESTSKSTSTKLRGEDRKPTTSAPTESEHSTENNRRTDVTTTETETKDTSTITTYVLYIIVALVLVVLLIIVVKVVRWKRSKGNNTQVNDTALTSNPAETESAPGTSQDMADPEDGVSYASISFTKNTNSRDKVQRRIDDDEGDAVTYSTVNVPSADPNNLYATINKPNK
ncbi:uncharacterized protein LOC124999270 isoform X2 [Mugil cephalus]|uniref:uncharacterized protein LOC124999270 isoform X2 n=1 Tax=Mugil cephalus TaxID=48193 RepID=UPI001FB63FA5|nr:uncharacterized protein LOC124999270 isoform X2 [Mugil cephalus]